MADTQSASSGAGIDLSQFYQVFFEEAGENLATMEQMLLNLDLASANDEELNAIFRCAHSVKGGAATFGFSDVAELTHQMETLLDKLRRHELEPHPSMVDVLLAAGDALKAQLARHQGAGGDPVDTAQLLASIVQLASGSAAAPASAAPEAAAAPAPAAAAAAPTAFAPATPAGERQLELTVGPLADPGIADNLLDLFKEIAELGQMEPLDAGHSADGMRRFKIVTKSSDGDLLDLFTFHVPRESMKLGPLTRGYGFHKNAPGAPTEAPPGDAGYGFFDDAPGAPGALPPVSATEVAPAAKPEVARVVAAPARAAADKGTTLEASTLRVSVDKVDQLINLVGELVITQAMLAQTGQSIDSAQHQQLAAGLADLQRNTRDLQEAVMSIRMIPMSVVFNRYPRMLRDLTAKLGKKVELVTQGEATELDKGLVEKITDPLTHLVRNSCDHGIELPDERVAKGKPAQGTITLAASHQGGSILIEVRDDGRGLNRDKLLKKARERGLDAPDSMSDAEVWNLIFAPGFSTADVVTDVSGRGVGMDVVKKNIAALNGSVEIDSAEGYGMSVKVRLPLTLAIMDGMSVGVGAECYILPLSSVVESFQVEPETIKTVGGANRVVRVREQYMPVIDLEGVFHVPRDKAAEGNGIMVIVEAEGGRVAVLVDELLGQQQVVVKNLESNYRKVANVSGATIMGDGRVALILDVGALVRLSRH
ncbi:MAG: chemotaxis protein CheA [Burkholderiaceae bacterium]|nr:chemotaxis protein CheA [Burkholderiaceae bacterium]